MSKKAEEKEVDFKALKTDITDLLNQILIKLKDVKSHEPDYNDDGIGTNNEYKEDDDPSKVSDEECYLQCLKSYCETAVKADASELEDYENKYYSSACW